MKWIIALVLAASLAGCAEEPTPDVEVIEAEEPLVLEATTQFFNQTGTLTSLAVGPVDALRATAEVPFTVAFGSARVDASAAAANQLTTLSITLPAELGEASYAQDGATSRATVLNPVPGNYTAIITSDAAINTQYVASIAVAPDDSISNLLSESVVIPPGQIFEVNLVMQLGDELHWDWTSSSTSDYNVHTHFDGEVQYLVEVSGTEGAGNITAARTGGHSFMWDNPSNTPQTVTYKAWGSFEVDSYFPPR